MPNDEIVTPEPTTPDNKEDVIEFLSDEPEGEEVIIDIPKEESKDKESKEEEVDELKEIEEELEEEEPDDDQLELVTPVRRREILEKYPKLFKDFPYLERAYYREQKFTEIYPTLEEANEARTKAQTLDNFEQDILRGNTESLMKSVKDDDPNAFYKLADNLLPSLYKTDQQAFNHVVGNVIKQAIIGMVNEGRRQQNDVLLNAAQIVNQFVFGTSDFVPPKPLAKQEQVNPEEDKLKQREMDFVRRQYETTQSELATKIENSLRATIEHHIDPKESMTDYVRRNAVKDAIADLGRIIKEDRRFQVINNKLWERALQSNFNEESVSRIRSAYLSKAKTLLPTVIKKARNEALKGSGKRVSETDHKGPIPTGKPAAPKVSAGKKSVPQGMSTLEFLMAED